MLGSKIEKNYFFYFNKYSCHLSLLSQFDPCHTPACILLVQSKKIEYHAERTMDYSSKKKPPFNKLKRGHPKNRF